jgi:hypothetical protein
VFASAFFWLSGWDEAATRARDLHGRFPYAGSLLERFGAAQQPLVDVYRAWLGARLAASGAAVPGRRWAGRPWAVALTVDVDVVRTRRLGRLARGLRAARPGEALRALLPGDARRQALHDLQALAGPRGPDGGGATWFFKSAARAPEDLAYRLEAPGVRRFLGGLRAGGHEVGLHPSYAAYDHPGHLPAERDRLAAGLGAPPRLVRNHFLRWAEPATPRLLEAAGFRLDSTLGFSRQPGFRRAVASPFRLFDRHANRPLGLWELPLAVMDTTLFEHRALPLPEAEEAAWRVCAAARRVGGCAVLLWHNGPVDAHTSAARLGVLARVLARARAEGALIAPLGAACAAWSPGGGGGNGKRGYT